jgi:hypothetical protein
VQHNVLEALAGYRVVKIDAATGWAVCWDGGTRFDAVRIDEPDAGLVVATWHFEADDEGPATTDEVIEHMTHTLYTRDFLYITGFDQWYVDEPNPPFKYEGAIIEGPTRLEDMIPALTRVLADIDPVAAKHERRRWPHNYAWFEEGNDLRDVSEDMTADADNLYVGLLTALMHAAPDGYDFGPHPGEGNCIGFWRVEKRTH